MKPNYIMQIKTHILNRWYQKKSFFWLIPLSWFFNFITKKRRAFYENKSRWHSPIPIIIVGNITLGGTGKTPVVAALAQVFKDKGYNPGIISRGFGAQGKHYPLIVSKDTLPLHAGDEPVMLAKMTQVPVIIDPNRVRAAQFLHQNTPCNIIISDDGLQHYALHRHLEIVVIDGMKLLGNGFTLPAGPLREPVKRLEEVNIVLVNGNPSNHLPIKSAYYFQLTPSPLKPLINSEQKPPKNATIHAVAGIGNPLRFFNLLTSLGFDIIPHPFQDHHQFSKKDLAFNDSLPIIMTEKDAVKCTEFAKKNYWFLPVHATIPMDCIDKIMHQLSLSTFSENNICNNFSKTNIPTASNKC